MVKFVADTLFSEVVGAETDETPSPSSDEMGAGLKTNDETSPDAAEVIEDGETRNQEGSVADALISNPVVKDFPRRTSAPLADSGNQPVIDTYTHGGIDPGVDPSVPTESRYKSSPTTAGAGSGSGLVAKLLEPIAKYGRAVAEQTATIASGNFEAGKLLAPAMAVREIVSTALNDPILGPGIEAFATIRGGIKTSRIDRARNRKEREADWKLEAKTNPGNYKPADIERMKQGKPPIGPDGHPMERHHVDGTHEGGIKKMTRTDHRYGPNYRKNHPKRDMK